MTPLFSVTPNPETPTPMRLEFRKNIYRHPGNSNWEPRPTESDSLPSANAADMIESTPICIRTLIYFPFLGLTVGYGGKFSVVLRG